LTVQLIIQSTLRIDEGAYLPIDHTCLGQGINLKCRLGFHSWRSELGIITGQLSNSNKTESDNDEW